MSLEDQNIQRDLQQFEILCQAFYSNNDLERQRAHEVLLPLVSSLDGLPKLQAILAHSNNLQSLLFAAAGLRNIFTRSWDMIPSSNPQQTATFILNYLYQRAPDILENAPEILTPFVCLWCRIVKLSWLENMSNQGVIPQIDQFLEGGNAHWVVGLHILTELVEEMKLHNSVFAPRLRRTALSFRDISMPQIIDRALKTLQQFVSGVVQVPNRSEEIKLSNQVLKLTHNCLAFDYMGTSPDESQEDQTTVMLPAAFNYLGDGNIALIFFDLYAICWNDPQGERIESAKLCLACLVLVASIRKSFFANEDQRNLYIKQMMTGTRRVLQTNLGLDHDDCHHEFCRLLGRIGSAGQLVEFAEFTDFESWTNLLFTYTIRVLENWRRMPNSMQYLLGAWISMLNPVNFRNPQVLAASVGFYIEQVVMAFVSSRFRLAEFFVEEGDDTDVENPLTNEVLRTKQLEIISHLGQCCFNKLGTKVLEVFQTTRNQWLSKSISQELYQEKILWFIYVTGALIGGECYLISHDDNASLEADALRDRLRTAVVDLVKESDQYPSFPEQIELSYLFFFGQFKKTCEALTKKYMSSPHRVPLINFIIEKLLYNLKHRYISEAIVKDTLSILYELASKVDIIQDSDKEPYFYYSARYLLENDEVKYWLLNTSPRNFPFLNVAGYGKYRTQLYTALARVFFLQLVDDSSLFETFLAPLTAVFEELAEGGDSSGLKLDLRAPDCQQAITGLARDLRGIYISCKQPHHFENLLNWLINKPHTQNGSRFYLFTRTLEANWDDYTVAVPILKFLLEFVMNRNNRINFVHSSAKGIILFKHISGALIAYAERILEEKNFENVYKSKYKGMALTLETFGKLFSGNYVAFEVFQLYGDQILERSLDVSLRMCLQIPPEDLQAYLKSLRSYYGFLEYLTKTFPEHFLKLPPDSVYQIAKSLEDGLCSFELEIFSQSCTIIDNLVTYIFNHKDENDSDSQVVNEFLAKNSLVLPRFLTLIFQIIITGEHKTLWTGARALLGLIFLCKGCFIDLKNQLLSIQKPETRDLYENSFNDLMKGIDMNLQASNKDNFTKNLYSVMNTIRGGITKASSPKPAGQ